MSDPALKDPACKCGHPRSRHFQSSTVKGHHACLVVAGRTSCECRRFVQGAIVESRPRSKLTPAQEEQRAKDLL